MGKSLSCIKGRQYHVCLCLILQLMSQGQMEVKEQKMEESMLLIRKDIQEVINNRVKLLLEEFLILPFQC